MSAIDQAVKNAMLNHYLNQSGRGVGQYPVFRGAQVQYGNGIGDIFRSIGRFLLPIFSSSAKTFVQSAAQGLSEGQSIKEAAKQALKPTLSSAMSGTAEQVMKKVSGEGKRRKRRGPKRRRAAKKQVIHKAPVYKGRGKRKGRRKSHKAKRKFVIPNF